MIPDSMTPNHNTQPIQRACAARSPNRHSPPWAPEPWRRWPAPATRRARPRAPARASAASSSQCARTCPADIAIRRAGPTAATRATAARYSMRARSNTRGSSTASDTDTTPTIQRALRRDQPADHHHDERDQELAIARPLEQVQHLPEEEPPHHGLAAGRRRRMKRKQRPPVRTRKPATTAMASREPAPSIVAIASNHAHHRDRRERRSQFVGQPRRAPAPRSCTSAQGAECVSADAAYAR